MFDKKNMSHPFLRDGFFVLIKQEKSKKEFLLFLNKEESMDAHLELIKGNGSKQLEAYNVVGDVYDNLEDEIQIDKTCVILDIIVGFISAHSTIWKETYIMTDEEGNRIVKRVL